MKVDVPVTSNAVSAMCLSKYARAHTLLGARHKYVSCHAACSKSYFHHDYVSFTELLTSTYDFTHHLVKPM